jgi:GNAT superfamily N-acetyltransferase
VLFKPTEIMGMADARPVHLDHRGCLALADALGDAPETVVPAHLLRRDFCRACVVGQPGHFAGAIVAPEPWGDEVTAFGDDADVLWLLLADMVGWRVVQVNADPAERLARRIMAETGCLVRCYDELLYVLTQPVRLFPTARVRRLSHDDLPVLAPPGGKEFAPGYSSSCAMLEEGVVAGAFVGGRLVASSVSTELNRPYVDVSVHTDPEWRGRGFATACAGIVAQCIQEAGRTPVWSTGEGHAASRHIAEKLGLRKVLRRVNVAMVGE